MKTFGTSLAEEIVKMMFAVTGKKGEAVNR